MSDRLLTPAEIIQLGREYENVQRWQGVRDFVYMLFGAHAQTVTISVTSEYNDNFYDDNISILVKDASGDYLGYDLSLPWWAQFNLSHLDRTAITEEGEVEYRMGLPYDITDQEEIRSALHALFAEKVGLTPVVNGAEHEPITLTFDLHKPPTIRFPSVYVRDC